MGIFMHTRPITYKGCKAELLTFVGDTLREYDAFLASRFADNREPIGWRMGVQAEIEGCRTWTQFRRYVTE